MDDFLNGTKPYELVANITDSFERERTIAQLEIQAKNIDKSINFKLYLKSYLNAQGVDLNEHYTEFTEQPMKLRLGTHYIATDSGVKYVTDSGTSIACMHPIMPITRLINVDTGEYGLELAYRHVGEQWRTKAFPRDVLASAGKIVDISKDDINVTTNNAKYLSGYLTTVQELNYDELPEKRSIDRFGWVGDSEFVPYCGSFVFDGEGKSKQIYDAVGNHGSATRWYDVLWRVRQSDKVIPRIVVAASLASVLVKPCGALPFIVHLWGKTGTGKTLALMLGASVWANPKGGEYTQTFNATAVGLERTAAFLHNLPVMLDELQTISKRGDFEDLMYQLTEGTGRSRGTKDASLRATGRWANSIITTGEQPITRIDSGGGTINRIVEIDCSSIDMFDNPRELAKDIKENYGYLGEAFVQCLCDPKHMEIARMAQERLQDNIFDLKPDVTEKQALSASLILTADYIATKYILNDDRALRPEDIVPFLANQTDADKDQRAYEWFLGWISENQAHIFDDDTDWSEVRTQVYGKVTQENSVAIVRSVFNDACEEAGFNPTAFARWLKEQKLTDYTEGKRDRLDKSVRIGGHTCQCIVLKESHRLEYDEFEEIMDSEEVSW